MLDVEDEKYTIEVLQDSFLQTAVPDNVHFLNAVSSSIQHDTSIVPIINSETNFEGVITVTDMLKTLGNFSGADEIGGIIVLEMARSQFAISEISRIVESNDSTVLHLNTTTNPTTGLLTVTLHISKKEIASIVATFERYDYDVVYSYGTEKFENEVSGNYQNLMNYLGI